MDMGSEAPGTESQEHGTRDHFQSSDACIISLGVALVVGLTAQGWFTSYQCHLKVNLLVYQSLDLPLI